MRPWKFIIAIVFILSGLGTITTPAPTLAADACACRNNSDCVNGSICIDNICVKDGAPYTTCSPYANFCGCSSDQDCAQGQLCNTQSNTCYRAGLQHTAPIPVPNCGIPQGVCDCGSDAECPEGTWCKRTQGGSDFSGHCMPRSNSGISTANHGGWYVGECGTQEVEPPAEQAWCKCSDYHDCNNGETCRRNISGDGPYADGDGYCVTQSTQTRPESCRSGTPNISPSEFNSGYSANNCPCTSNAWCNDGETCSALYGYCINATTGEAPRSFECAAPCTCNNDDDCGEGQHCQSGAGTTERFCYYANGTIVPPRHCEPNTSDGSQSTPPSDACLCYSNDNCQNGETCSDGGYCVQTNNSSQYPRCTGGSGGVGDGRIRTFCSCSSTSDCGTGEMCSSGTCYEPFGDGWLKSEPPCTSAPIANACYCRGSSDCLGYSACNTHGDCQCDTSTNSCIFVNGPYDDEYAQCYGTHDHTDHSSGSGSGSHTGDGDDQSGGIGVSACDTAMDYVHEDCVWELERYWNCSNSICEQDFVPCSESHEQCHSIYEGYWECQLARGCGLNPPINTTTCPSGVCPEIGYPPAPIDNPIYDHCAAGQTACQQAFSAWRECVDTCQLNPGNPLCSYNGGQPPCSPMYSLWTECLAENCGAYEESNEGENPIFNLNGICDAAESACQQILAAYWACSNAACPTDYTPCDAGQQQCGAQHSAYWGCVGNVCGSAANPDYFDCPGGVCSTLGTPIPPFSAPPWQDQTTSATQFDPTVDGNPDQRTGHDETFDTDPNNYE